MTDEPVPGAAVRALAERWSEFRSKHPAKPEQLRAEGYNAALEVCERELVGALRADSFNNDDLRKLRHDVEAYRNTSLALEQQRDAKQARIDELEAALRADGLAESAPRFQVTDGEWHEACDHRGSLDRTFFEHLNAILARRPATDVVRPTVCTLEQAHEILRTQLRSNKTSGHERAEVLRDAINAKLRPATDEAEVLRPRFQVTLDEVSDAWDLVRDNENVFPALVDNLNAVLARRPATDEAEALRARSYARTTNALLRKERDEALAKLEEARTKVSGRDAIIVDQNKQLSGLREQLAARPGPVVITKLLATMAVAEYRGVEPRWVSGYDGDRMLAALTKTFGASVSVPQGEDAQSCVNCLRHLAEYRGAHNAWTDCCRERDQLRAELEKTRAELEACEKAMSRVALDDDMAKTVQDSLDRSEVDCHAGQAMNRTRTLTIYRDDSTVQVVLKRVKAFFWTAGNTVLTVACWTDDTGDAHSYTHWPRERICWFKDSGSEP